MANTSNAFSVLKPGYEVGLGGKKKNKRQKKKASQAVVEASGAVSPQLALVDTDETTLAPLKSADLESQVRGCKSGEERLHLLNTWKNNMSTQQAYLDSNGDPTSFRTVLLNSQALEVLTEKIMADPGWSRTTEKALGGCLEEVLKFTDTELIPKLLAATGKVVSVLSSRGGAMFEAGQRAIGELVVSLKKSDSAAESAEDTKWNPSRGTHAGKPKGSHRQNEQKTERRPTKGESRSDYELSIALEDLKNKQREVDEVREEAKIAADVLQSVTIGSIRTIADLKTLMSMVREPVGDGFSDVSKKKGKKTKRGTEASHGPLAAAMQPYDSEAAALAEQENQLSTEIAGLETKLASLKSQLVAIKEALTQLQQRKTAIANSSMPLQGVSLITSEEQKDVVTRLEDVLSELEGNPGASNVEKEAAAQSYLEATQKVMDCVSSKQEEILKNVTFLKEAILRKHEHEEQLMSMATCSSKMDLITTNRKQKENLERQMREALQSALSNLRKSEKVFDDAKARKDIVDRATEDQLSSSIASIRAVHSQAVAESSITKKMSPPSPVAAPAVKKRFDASKIVKQAEMEVAQEMNRGRRGGHNHHPHQPPENQQEMQSASCIVGFSPEPELGPRVKIPSAEDEMVPAPVTDWMDPHFSPSAIGNGSHSQPSPVAPAQVNPIAPQTIGMPGPHIPLAETSQTAILPSRNNTIDLPQADNGPRGWKKISPKDGDSNGISSDPTPAEALQFTKPQK